MGPFSRKINITKPAQMFTWISWVLWISQSHFTDFKLQTPTFNQVVATSQVTWIRMFTIPRCSPRVVQGQRAVMRKTQDGFRLTPKGTSLSSYVFSFPLRLEAKDSEMAEVWGISTVGPRTEGQPPSRSTWRMGLWRDGGRDIAGIHGEVSQRCLTQLTGTLYRSRTADNLS